jgi:hypothetical protein
MEVFFIGFPKLGIKNASSLLRKGLNWIFKPILVKGFKKLKKDAEALAISYPSTANV